MNNKNLLSNYTENFCKVKALVIGDIMLDRFVYGTIDRISPEAPVPVFKFKNEKTMLGGAGNVAANLVSLGVHSEFLGIIGKDEAGRKLSKLLNKIGVHSHLLRLSDYPTIVKTRLIAGSNHLARVDQEEILPIIEHLLPRYKKILLKAINKVDIVLISDYNKGLLTSITTPMIIEICKQFNKPVIVDPKGNDYSKYRGATLIKPNLKEFGEATGQKYNPKDQDFSTKVENEASLLIKKLEIKNLLVTLSEYGMLHISAEDPKQITQIPTQAKEVFDVSGAGDTVLATIGACLGANVPIVDAMKIANVASGIVVGKLGTATVSNNELYLTLKNIESNHNNNLSIAHDKKIISLDEAKEIVSKLKSQGKTIGFTNGCFDCCHLGHLNSFIEAKKHCDVLIVAINSDASIKRYKGEDRPIQDEKTRSLLISSLQYVDYVIVFNEDTPLHIVEELKPNIVAKEGYTLDKWPEGRLAISYGGQAITLKRIDGYSTTNLIKKLED